MQQYLKSDAKELAHQVEAFEVWYANNRNYRRTSMQISVTQGTLKRWSNSFEWVDRADERDVAFKARAQNAAAIRHAQMIERHGSAARTLIGRALEYFEHSEITSARDAIQAAKIGIELERRIEGLPDWIQQVTGSSTDDLIRQRAEFINRIRIAASDGDGGGAEEPWPGSGGLTGNTSGILTDISDEDAGGIGGSGSSRGDQQLLALPAPNDRFCPGDPGDDAMVEAERNIPCYSDT